MQTHAGDDKTVLNRPPTPGDMIRLLWIDSSYICGHIVRLKSVQAVRPRPTGAGRIFVILNVDDLSHIHMAAALNFRGLRGPYLLTCLSCDSSQREHLFSYEAETIVRHEAQDLLAPRRHLSLP